MTKNIRVNTFEDNGNAKTHLEKLMKENKELVITNQKLVLKVKDKIFEIEKFVREKFIRTFLIFLLERGN